MEPCNRSGVTRATIKTTSTADAAQLDKAHRGYGNDNSKRAFFTALGYNFLRRTIIWEPGGM